MALRQRTRSLVGYGIDNALQGLAPQPVVANRAPTTSDTAPLATLWTYTATDQAWILTSIVNGAAVWTNFSGGAGVFSSLLVNPGPVTTEGTGAVSISGDAVATTIGLGDGAGAKIITIGSVTGASSTSILAGSGNFSINGAAATTYSIGAAATTGTINIGGTGLQTGTITIGGGTGAQTIDIATGGTGVKTVNIATSAVANVVTVGSTTGAASTTIQSGPTGTLDIESNNGAISLTSGTGAIDIASDATTSAVNVGRGAGVGSVKTVIVGCSAGASATTIASGTGGIDISSNNGDIDITPGTGDINIATDATISDVNIGTGAAAKTVVIGSTNTSSTTTIQCGSTTGNIELDAVGAITVSPITATAASPTASITSNFNLIATTFTGFTTAAAGTQDFTITSSKVLATSGIFVTVANASAGNDAQMSLIGVTQAVGSIVVHTKNNGSQALDSTVYINVWIIS